MVEFLAVVVVWLALNPHVYSAFLLTILLVAIFWPDPGDNTDPK